ncbi:WXG100 family type VII secretion target [Nocardia sp. NBC_00416]|uniref:WXG100 family type VII secretion target n=1 Tax=Nocardia sp. NBC_00416 TaxID=2975991 RepID=UPI002E2157E0
MTNPIFANYEQIYDTTARVKAVLSGMTDNIADLRTMKQQLLDEFKGSGAGGFQTVADELEKRLDSYEASLTGLNGKVIEVATKGGRFDVEDGNIANKFMGLV